MKKLIELIIVAVLLSGCGGSALSIFTTPNPSLPDIGGDYKALGFLGGNKVITLYGQAGVVCVEYGDPQGRPYTSNMAAFSCWDVDAAPGGIKGLIPEKFLKGGYQSKNRG